MPGKLLYTADALSRARSKSTDEQSRELEEEVEAHVVPVITSLHATPERPVPGGTVDRLCVFPSGTVLQD